MTKIRDGLSSTPAPRTQRLVGLEQLGRLTDGTVSRADFAAAATLLAQRQPVTQLVAMIRKS